MKRPKGFSSVPPQPVHPSKREDPAISEPDIRSAESHEEHPTVDLSDIDFSDAELQNLETTDNEVSESSAEVEIDVSDAETQTIIRAGAGRKLFQRNNDDRDLVEAKKRLRQAEGARKQRERHERKRFTEHNRKRRTKTLIGLGAVTALVLTVAVGVFTPLMSVKKFDVRGADRVPVEEITGSLSDMKGRPLALVKNNDVFDSLKPITLIQSFEVEKIPPHTLRIVVYERQPVVAVVNGESLDLIDPAGVRVATVTPDDLPEGIPVADGVRDQYDSEQFQAIAHVLRVMPESTRMLVTGVSADTPQQVMLQLGDGLQVLWGDSAATVRKSLVLEAMLDALIEVPLGRVDVSSPDAPVYVPM